MYFQALQEISVEDRRRKLENSNAELNAINNRINDVNKNVKGWLKNYIVHIFFKL